MKEVMRLTGVRERIAVLVREEGLNEETRRERVERLHSDDEKIPREERGRKRERVQVTEKPAFP